ncbi:MAG: hypothetical protein RSB41_02985 [Bacilli bacterium]
MKTLNDLKNMYKTNKPLFNMVIFVVLCVLILWQAIFSLILPNRINILILLTLFGGLVFFYFKNS